ARRHPWPGRPRRRPPTAAVRTTGPAAPGAAHRPGRAPSRRTAGGRGRCRGRSGRPGVTGECGIGWCQCSEQVHPAAHRGGRDARGRPGRDPAERYRQDHGRTSPCLPRRAPHPPSPHRPIVGPEPLIRGPTGQPVDGRTAMGTTAWTSAPTPAGRSRRGTPSARLPSRRPRRTARKQWQPAQPTDPAGVRGPDVLVVAVEERLRGRKGPRRTLGSASHLLRGVTSRARVPTSWETADGRSCGLRLRRSGRRRVARAVPPTGCTAKPRAWPPSVHA
ncbi:MAG: hypothetical protein QOG20_6364, partial [Pseudonocardiales bacterium]|nr:hypothetical protein [Pseudonocardiales bacterium]